MKKILSMILTMTLLIGCAIPASADNSDFAYFMDSSGNIHYLWKETSGDGWNYDYATSTLTLNNLTGTFFVFHAVKENQTLKVVTKGTNRLENFTVSGDGDVIFSGDGTLNLIGTQDSGNGNSGKYGVDESSSLWCQNSITVDGGIVNVSPKKYKTEYEGHASFAIYTYDGITVNSGTVNINLPVVKGNSKWGGVEQGIWAKGNVVINGGAINIKAVGGNDAVGSYRDISCKKMILDGGHITCNLLCNVYKDKIIDGIKSKGGKTFVYVGAMSDGIRVTGTGLATVGGHTYALVKSVVKTGKVQTVTIGGKTYVVNKSGIIQKAKSGKKIVDVSKKSYIVNTSGVVQKSGSAKYKLIKAGKKYYIVNKSGLVQKNKKSIKIGKYVYKTSKTGVATRKK